MDYQVGDQIISLVSGEEITKGKIYTVIDVDSGNRGVCIKGNSPQNFWLSYCSVELADKDSIDITVQARGFGCDINLCKKVSKEVLNTLLKELLLAEEND